MEQPKKVCLVTGASSGIGYAIASALIADGYAVVATARQEDRLQDLPDGDKLLLAGNLCDPAFQDQLETQV